MRYFSENVDTTYTVNVHNVRNIQYVLDKHFEVNQKCVNVGDTSETIFHAGICLLKM